LHQPVNKDQEEADHLRRSSALNKQQSKLKFDIEFNCKIQLKPKDKNGFELLYNHQEQQLSSDSKNYPHKDSFGLAVEHAIV
jgi:hypothetical protein